jgi:DNA-binding MarR family transcriptional regulator
MKVAWKKISEFVGPEESPGFLLWQVSTAWRREIETALATLGMTHPQFVLLASLGWLTQKGGKVSQVELARHSKTDIAMTSQVLRTLEKKGYVARVQREGNEKSKFPSVTKSGAQLIEQAIPLVEKVDRDFFKSLGKDVGKWIEILQKLVLPLKE